jgi:hypothetical protein
MARRRLPRTTEDALVAALLLRGEIVYDETDARFRYGDGATAGGLKLPRMGERGFTTKAAAVAARLPAVQTSLFLEGFYAPGDGGEGPWTRSAEEPSHAAKFQTADGAWWAFSGEVVDVRQLGAKIDGLTDGTAIVNAALSLGREVIVPGRVLITGVVTVPDRAKISGAGHRRGFLAMSATGQVKMSGAGYASRIGSAVFRDLAFVMTDDVTSVSTPGLLIEKADQCVWDNCVFYHVQTVIDTHQNHTFTRCRFFGGIAGSQLISRTTFQPDGGQGISEYPSWTDCWFSGHPIDLIDTVEPKFHHCHQLAGAFGIRSRQVNATGTEDYPFFTGPIIEFCTFDSITGHAIDIENGGVHCRLVGNFISAGRSGVVAGARLANCAGMQVVANEFNWCGMRGITLENCENISFSTNLFINMMDGAGIWIGGGCSGLSIIGNTFRNRPLWGGSEEGFTTLAIETPGGNLENSVVSGNIVEGMTNGIALYVEGTGNYVRDNPGVPSTAERPMRAGVSASRPADPVNGHFYFDTTLGLPIWWDGVANEWVKADGTAA